MKKTLLLALMVFTMAALAFAQDSTTAPTTVAPNTTWYNVDQNNGHVRHGCMLCHAPHSSNGSVSTAAVSPISFGGPASFNLAQFDSSWGTLTSSPISTMTLGTNANPAVRGDLYLWGTALTSQSYTTYEGTIITPSGVTKSTPVVHTLLCMSCHDNANSAYGMSAGYGQAPPAEYGATNANPVTQGYGDHIGLSQIGGGPGGPAVWDPTSSLANSHPVHAAIPQDGSMWKLSATGNADGSISFTDTTFQLTASLTGHPAKLWYDGTYAYVECTSCHDPHRETAFAYWNGTQYVIGTTNSTIYYLRGPYSDPTVAATTAANGNINANFCRSCHLDKSEAFANNAVGGFKTM